MVAIDNTEMIDVRTLRPDAIRNLVKLIDRLKNCSNCNESYLSFTTGMIDCKKDKILCAHDHRCGEWIIKEEK